MTSRTSPAPAHGRRRRSKGAAHAGPARKGSLVAGLVALAALTAAGLAVTEFGGGAKESGAGARETAAPRAAPDPGPAPSEATASRKAAATRGTRRDTGGDTGIPKSGPGTFGVAGAGGAGVGGGRIVTYSVAVEDGLDESAEDVAEEVDRILADPRGWTADGATGFRRVAGDAADFAVQLATPDTVDRICGEYSLDTGGEVNCNVGRRVMVNLKRWRLATPAYAHDVPSYRALIVNHEVGHYLGHGHETCPGAGEPAPAMMQQIKGLHGCVVNAWPYARDGKRITGPPVP
ncbi:DUF3152 domain-containing protein [Streptomyces sp. NPDC059134]|uniref:DUF3152 domain-containing protein n=1 Tax=Streptomyces sp. NPDC059134 TaxID=3346738 RepID=UPI0036B44B3D